MRVADDGRGFDPTAVPDGHLGLAGMRSRAERLGGTLVGDGGRRRRDDDRGRRARRRPPATTASRTTTGADRRRAGRERRRLVVRPWPHGRGSTCPGVPHRGGAARRTMSDAAPQPADRHDPAAARRGSSSSTPTTGPARASSGSSASGTGSRSSERGAYIADAIALVRSHRPDVVILDPRLPELPDGLALIRRIHAIDPDDPHPRRRLDPGPGARQALTAGADCFVRKTFKPGDLVRRRRALHGTCPRRRVAGRPGLSWQE